MKRVTVGGSFKGFLGKVRRQMEDLQGRPKLRVVIRNNVPYFKFVEYGTSKMEARAMVRKSLPLIQEFMRQQLSGLGAFFDDADLDQVKRLGEQFALDEIRSRTPIESGTLVRGFEIEIVRE
jgi:hypothetical protein